MTTDPPLKLSRRPARCHRPPRWLAGIQPEPGPGRRRGAVGVFLSRGALGGLLGSDVGGVRAVPRRLGGSDRHQVTRREAEFAQVGIGLGDKAAHPGVERGVAAGDLLGCRRDPFALLGAAPHPRDRV